MTPESALGRLNNLREQLVDTLEVIDQEKQNVQGEIDDLDDIIRCIKRGTSSPSTYAFTCPECNKNVLIESDSEDTEAR